MIRFVRDIPDRVRARLEIARLLRSAGWWIIVPAVAIQLLTGAVPLALILTTSAVVGHVPGAVQAGVHSHEWHRLELLLLLAIGFFVLQALASGLEWLSFGRIGRRIDGVFRDRLLAASFAPDGIGTHEDPRLSEALHIAAGQIRGWDWSPGDACGGLLSVVGRYTRVLVLATTVGIVFAWWAALALVLAVLSLRFVWRAGQSDLERAFDAVRPLERRELYFRDLAVGAGAAKEIRVFGLGPWLRGRYRDAALDASRELWRWRFKIFFKPFLPATAISLALASTVFAGIGHAGAQHALSLHDLALALQASLVALSVAGYWDFADGATSEGIRAIHAISRFEEDVAAQTPPRPATTRDPAGLPLREIRFEHVAFTYPGAEQPVFVDLDLTIPAGRSLAIVGLNGAGKTTLVKLLARLYEPSSGRITADGIDIREFPARAWQRRIGAIFQDFVHYGLSVHDNVAFGAIDRTDDLFAIRRALGRVGALEHAERLAAGLDTILSRQYAGGTDLSGGQWQRIAIARALFAVEGGASVLVLDEPTANLDVRAEAAFFERFIELTEGLTTIVISHRFSTVRRADRIVVLEDGAPIEDGTHADLLARGGRYAELFHLQAKRFAEQAAP